MSTGGTAGTATEAPVAPRIDPSALSNLGTSRLAQRVVDMLNAGNAREAGQLARIARSQADRVALLELRDLLLQRRREAKEIGADTPAQRLQLLEAIVALPPDDPAMLIQLALAARKAGDNDRFEQVLSDVAARFPEDPRFRELVAALDRDFMVEVDKGGARVELAGMRLAAAGGLKPEHFPALVKALRHRRAPAERLARLRALCPAIAEDPEVWRELREWRDEALILPPGLALQELARIITILPPETVLSDMVKLTLDGGRTPHATLAELLRTHPGALAPAVMEAAALKWHRKLANLCERGKTAEALACFEALDALDMAQLTDVRHAIELLDEMDDAGDRLPDLVARWLAADGSAAFLAPRVKEWTRQFREAVRQRSAADSWRLGRRLLAAGNTSAMVLDSMMAATARIDPAFDELLSLVERFDTLDIPCSPPLTPRGQRHLIAAVAARFAAGETERPLRALLWAMHHLDIAAPTLDALAAPLIETPPPGFDEVLNRLEERRPGAVVYLRAMRTLAAGDNAQAATLFLEAAEAKLSASLQEVARQECSAASFTRLSPEEYPDEPAIVLIEGAASASLIARASGLAPTVQVCAAVYVGLDPAESNVSGEIEFRYVDLPEVSEGADRFSTWAIGALERSAKVRNLKLNLPRRQYENLRRHLFHRLFTQLRVAYNFRQALAISGYRRAFFIVRQGGVSRITIRTLLDEGGWEVRAACGAPATRMRRKFSAEALAAPLERSAPPTVPADPTEAKLPAKRSGALASLPRITAVSLGAVTRPVLLLVVTSARADVLAPLPDLVAGLAQRWTPVLVFIDAADMMDFFRARLARDTRPGVAEVAFHGVTTRDLWSEAQLFYDTAPLTEAVAAIDPATSRMRSGGLLLGTDTVDVFSGVEGAAAVTVAIDGWARRLMKDLSPVCALFTHSAILEPNAMCSTLGDLGLPTFWLQMLQHPRDKRFKCPPAAHHLLLDRYSAELWKDFLGVPERGIAVVGSLRFSATLNRVRDVPREQARAELSIAEGERLVVIATQPVAVHENLKLVENVLEAVGTSPTLRILVKLHPSEADERIEVYRRALQAPGLEGRTAVSKTHDIYRAVIASDLVVTQHSNVGIEAFLLDRAVLALVLDAGIATFSIAEHGVEEALAGPVAVARIRALLTDPAARAEADEARRRWLDENPELHDGIVTERIVERIGMVLDQRSGN